jgi:hypothetical protein
MAGQPVAQKFPVPVRRDYNQRLPEIGVGRVVEEMDLESGQAEDEVCTRERRCRSRLRSSLVCR